MDDYVFMTGGEWPECYYIQSLAGCPCRSRWCCLREKTWESMRLKIPECFLTAEFCCYRSEYIHHVVMLILRHFFFKKNLDVFRAKTSV